MSATSEIAAGEVRENKNGVWKKQAIMDTLNKMKINFDPKDKVGDLREQLAKALEAAAEPQGWSGWTPHDRRRGRSARATEGSVPVNRGRDARPKESQMLDQQRVRCPAKGGSGARSTEGEMPD